MPLITFDGIGTHWEIETERRLEDRLRQHILERVERFDATYSRFRSDSIVSKAAAARDGGRFEFPREAGVLFDLYDRLHAATGGAVDPLVGRDLERLGYDSVYSLVPPPNLVEDEDTARERANWFRDVARDGNVLITRRPLVVDVGAAGKGYLVDILCQILSDAGIDRFCIDGSGDIRHSGPESIAIGLEHPLEPEMVVGVARLQNRALCASAVNRRAWGDGLHHVLDARTGDPTRDVVATWVVTDDALTADGVATALFFVGGDRLACFPGISFVRMFADGRAEISPDFDGEMFS